MFRRVHLFSVRVGVGGCMADLYKMLCIQNHRMIYFLVWLTLRPPDSGSGSPTRCREVQHGIGILRIWNPDFKFGIRTFRISGRDHHHEKRDPLISGGTPPGTPGPPKMAKMSKNEFFYQKRGGPNHSSNLTNAAQASPGTKLEITPGVNFLQVFWFLPREAFANPIETDILQVNQPLIRRQMARIKVGALFPYQTSCFSSPNVNSGF